MAKHILVSWTHKAEDNYEKDTDHITAFNGDTNEDYAVDTLNSLHEKDSMVNVKVRLYDTVTGVSKELEPYLDGFRVRLREVVEHEDVHNMQRL